MLPRKGPASRHTASLIPNPKRNALDADLSNRTGHRICRRMGGPARRFPGWPVPAAPPRSSGPARLAYLRCRLCAPPAGPLPARSPGRSGAPASPSLRHSGPLPSWKRPPPAGGALGPRSMVSETSGSYSSRSSRCSGGRSLKPGRPSPAGSEGAARWRERQN